MNKNKNNPVRSHIVECDLKINRLMAIKSNLSINNTEGTQKLEKSSGITNFAIVIDKQVEELESAIYLEYALFQL